MSTPSTKISVDGVEYAVDADWGMTEHGEHRTAVTVRRLDSGEVVAEADCDGWLPEHRLDLQGEILLTWSVPPAAAHERGMMTDLAAYGVFDHSVKECVRFTLVRGEVTETRVAPVFTETKVRYKHQDGQVQGLVVFAHVTEAQREAVSDLLLRYGPHLNRAPVPYLGTDPICLHDAAFDAVHDEACALVSLDALAGALLVEIEALLAETDPA